MVRELQHHLRVVVRRHLALGGAPDRGLGQPAPLLVRQPAIGLVDGAEVLLELADAVELRRACRRSCGCARPPPRPASGRCRSAPGAGCGPSARRRRAGCRSRRPSRCRASDSSRMPSWSTSDTASRRVEIQAVLLLRRRAPLRQAAADGVGADDAVARRTGAPRYRPCRGRCAPGRARRSRWRRAPRPTACSGSPGLRRPGSASCTFISSPWRATGRRCRAGSSRPRARTARPATAASGPGGTGRAAAARPVIAPENAFIASCR